jgi:radical SAM protein with 4Fe4S-binding SPASM domain
MTDNNRAICPMPFIGFDIEPMGLVKPCCIYEGDIGNINRQSVSEIWNSDALREIRESLLAGKKIAGCRQCWLEEKTTNTSKRLRELNNFDSSVYTDPKIKRLDIKLGNTCNLKCRICNPGSSSLFNSENKLIQSLQKFGHVDVIDKKATLDYKWYKNDEFWNQILEYGNEIEQLDLMGGEPLLDKTHARVLQILIDRGLAKNIVINYTSNGTTVPDFNLLKNFKKILFNISGDAIEKRFEYNRYPAKWDEFKENIEKIRMQADSFLISYSVSNYSLFGIPDALDYYTEHGFIVWFNYVHLTEASNARNMHPDVKEQFRQLIAERRKPEWSNTRVNIDEVLQFIDNEYNPEHFREFIRVCKMRDQFRDQDFRDYLPEFAPYADIV